MRHVDQRWLVQVTVEVDVCRPSRKRERELREEKL